MRKASFALLLLILPLAACGSSGGDAKSSSGAGSDAKSEAALPEISGCTFSSGPPTGIIAGTATVTGKNTTGSVIDTTSIRFQLTDSSGTPIGDESYSQVAYWQPDEEIAMQVGVFSESAIAEADCKIIDVSPGRYAEQTSFDDSAVTCTIAAETDLGTADADIDISAVSDAPSDAELFATGAAYDGAVRVGEISASFEPGEKTHTESLAASGDDLSCKIRELRLP